MILAISGGRAFTDWDVLKKGLDEWILANGIPKVIISGGAKGADSLAGVYAKGHNIPYIELKPEWQRYGEAAGPIRNKQIIDHADALVAFEGGRGTANAVELARKKGIPVLEVNKWTKLQNY